MTKKTLNDLSQLSGMNVAMAMTMILLIDFAALVKNKAMPLSEVMPTSIWQRLSQAQRGFIGRVFSDFHKDLGFEYAGKDESDTTNLYRLVTDVEDL